MATASIHINIRNLRGPKDTGVDEFEFHIDTEYSTEEVVAYMSMLPEVLPKIVEALATCKM